MDPTGRAVRFADAAGFAKRFQSEVQPFFKKKKKKIKHRQSKHSSLLREDTLPSAIFYATNTLSAAGVGLVDASC